MKTEEKLPLTDVQNGIFKPIYDCINADNKDIETEAYRLKTGPASIYFYGRKVCQFSIRKNDGAVIYEINNELVKLLPDGLKKETGAASTKVFVLEDSQHELIIKYFQTAYQYTYEQLGMEIGCCGLYEECSNAKKCIYSERHPDEKRKDSIMYGDRCWYNKNLKKGLVFYGKNKNVK